MPDWVWGAGLGVIVLLFVGGFFLVSGVTGGGGGGGGGGCDEPLGKLGNSTISAEAFVEEDAGLGRVITLLNTGDRTGAEAAFYGPVHNFTHNVDPVLREKDEEQAKALCEQVIRVENELSERAPSPQIAQTLATIQDMLRDAAETLGYPRPG